MAANPGMSLLNTFDGHTKYGDFTSKVAPTPDTSDEDTAIGGVKAAGALAQMLASIAQQKAMRDQQVREFGLNADANAALAKLALSSDRDSFDRKLGSAQFGDVVQSGNGLQRMNTAAQAGKSESMDRISELLGHAMLQPRSRR